MMPPKLRVFVVWGKSLLFILASVDRISKPYFDDVSLSQKHKAKRHKKAR